jgi:hypothetical protein
MVNKKFLLGMGMLVLALVFGMMAVGCEDGSTNDNGGTVTITDIPATYNGKYAYFEAWNYSNVQIGGCESVNMSTETITLVKISNEKAILPLWVFNESTGSVSKYSGSHAFNQNDKITVGIFSTATLTDDSEPIAAIYFSSITFSNGSATKSANDGVLTK